MPAKSKKQQKLFGIALAIKRGELPPSYSQLARVIAKHLTEKKIKEFAKTKFKKTKKRLKRKNVK